MFNRLIAMISFTLLCLLVAGCSSVRDRTERSAAEWRLYPGLQRGATDLGDAFQGKLKGPPWSPVEVVPILLTDLPFSLVMDSLALPYDLYRIHARAGDDGPVTPLPESRPAID